MKELVERYLRLKMVEEYARIDAQKARAEATYKNGQHAAAVAETKMFESRYPEVVAFLNAPGPEKEKNDVGV